MPLGKDLAYIRKSQNLTLEDIQNAIKIPLTTLKSIEDESIFHEKAENPTYRRSFVRSYAKVLKIDDAEVVKALDAMEAGTYNADLLTDSEKETETEIEIEPATSENIFSEADEEAEAPALPPTPAPEKPKNHQPPEVNSINWADMGRKFSPVGKNSRTMLVFFIVVIVTVLAGAGYIFSDSIAGFLNLNNGTPTPSEELAAGAGQPTTDPAPVDSANIIQDMEETEADQTSPENRNNLDNRNAITLGDTLTVAVYAAYGQLEPVRVTSDFNNRTNPYWMEEGSAYYFDFQDTLLVRGQYSRMLLLFNGHPIDNPRSNHFDSASNSVMITRSALDQSKYLAPAPNEFPLDIGAPDSIIYRVRF